MTLDLNKITEELSDKDIRKRIYELFEWWMRCFNEFN
jgi:hypothetical protein